MPTNDITILPWQQEISQALPVVLGNIDYSEFEKIIKRIDSLLVKSEAQAMYMREYVKKYIDVLIKKTGQDEVFLPDSKQVQLQIEAKEGLRCIIARRLLDESFRRFSCRLADSPLLQWFCGINRIDAIRVPSKSTLQRYESVVSEEKIREIIYKLVKEANNNHQMFELSKPVNISDIFIDLTCVKANIHYPVDWVLLRDATITLMKAVKLIRKYGLKKRMEPPEIFIKEINKLSIKMTHSRHRPGSKKYRKNILRTMKRLMKKIKKHAKNHRELLENEWNRTMLTKKQKDVIVKRMDNVINQLPAAIEQAHERIIGERQVENEKKYYHYTNLK